jgi:hypothetical protein
MGMEMTVKKTSREYRKARKAAILTETRADMKLAKELGEKADRLYDEAMRRRIGMLT